MAFPFCEFEDQMNCIWFAPMQGNGKGKGNGKGDSFVNFMGHILYAEELVFIAILAIVAAAIAVIIFDRN